MGLVVSNHLGPLQTTAELRTNITKMLSRVVQRSVKEVRPALVAARPTHTTAVNKAEERDEVNFPRRVRPTEPGRVRMGFIPEEFFQYMYPKTGVTGPYMFGVGVSTYLLAKEIDEIEGSWVGYRVNSIKHIQDSIEAEKTAQWEAEGQSMLFDAKRENVQLQLEAAYRARLATVHGEVKKRLDYQMETANVHKRVEQKHMVDWIVNSVHSSITPEQEAAALNKCVADLKALAA